MNGKENRNYCDGTTIRIHSSFLANQRPGVRAPTCFFTMGPPLGLYGLIGHIMKKYVLQSVCPECLMDMGLGFRASYQGISYELY